MNTCFADCPEVVTHYFNRTDGSRSYLCHYHAERFGYPQHLVHLIPAPWRKRYGYLVNLHDGSGQGEAAFDLWAFEERRVENWLSALGCDDPFLLDDAAWEPYRAHQAERGDLVYEVTRVTVLPLVHV